jgi:hypothetical protein
MGRVDDTRAAALEASLAPLNAPPRLASMLARAETRLTPYFAANRIAYPPPAATFIALKEEGRLELWAQADEGWRFVRSYLIRATSGRLGPKLREGDRQVPEGVYRISALNPNSRFHLSLRLDYPNEFDRARAADEGRTQLGGDIMIHGNRVSIGCIAVGDVAVEELFALATRLGPGGVRVVVSPMDLRRAAPAAATAQAAESHPWLDSLYGSIAHTLGDFPLPPDEAAPVAAPRAAVRKARCREADTSDCVRRCLKGDAASCARAGSLYADAGRPDANADKAWTFLRRACTAGDASGCAELGRLHVADDGLRRDVGLAASLAGAACDAGDGRGCAVLGRLCSERLVYPGAQAQCAAERVAHAADVQQAVCSGWCDASIFDGVQPGSTSR